MHVILRRILPPEIDLFFWTNFHYVPPHAVTAASKAMHFRNVAMFLEHQFVVQFQEPSNSTCDHAGHATRKFTEALNIKLEATETLNLVPILQLNIIFNTVSGNINALSKLCMAL
jgi:hypothetical protein